MRPIRIVIAFIAVTGANAATAAADPPEVLVDRDDFRVTESCVVRIDADRIADDNGNGVVHISGDDLTIDFAGRSLRGAGAETDPDRYTGIGIRVSGSNITLRNAVVSGFKVGIYAEEARSLTIADCDVSDNFRQRLRSTPRREDAADWLHPHDNDANEWMDNYGAGIYVEDSERLAIHGIRARDVQNGIILDRVEHSKIYENDCSFLSGWGLAMWRSSHNVIAHNAFDFCIRGYSDGVYNRGQDSAGILMFEQCSDNIVAANSVTHGGDGIFAFAGQEALGARDVKDDPAWYAGRGDNRNLFFGNDLSYAAAHGLELTFSFDNVIAYNRFIGNAICGVWGGYSQRTDIARNTFEANGEAGYGLERGGVNIEHGVANRIFLNQFKDDACGIHLWWDLDHQLFHSPWYRANSTGDDAAAIIVDNTFINEDPAVHLRDLERPVERAGNTFRETEDRWRIEGEDVEIIETADSHPLVEADPGDLPGTPHLLGRRRYLDGREHIIMTEWGPYDWSAPRLILDGRSTDDERRPVLTYRLVGPAMWSGDLLPEVGVRHEPGAPLDIDITDGPEGSTTLRIVRITAREPGVHPLTIWQRPVEGPAQAIDTVLVSADWRIVHFASPCDPRKDVEAWREAAEGGVVTHAASLDERYGMAGPGGELPADQFGTIATTTLRFPTGMWRIRTTSDDGIRVFFDEKPVIDNWTWHAPTEDVHEFTLDEPRTIDIRVEHFELDGYAMLALDVERVK